MNRRSFGILAIIIILLMAIVATAGLDSLPRDLRKSAVAATVQLRADTGRFAEQRAYVERIIASDSALFAKKAGTWRELLNRSQAQMKDADAQAAALGKLAEANRREDRAQVEEKLAKLSTLRAEAVRSGEQVRLEAERWLGYKRDAPRFLESIRTDYAALHAWDAAGAVAAVQKAQVDWPEKRDDLQRRMDALVNLKTQGETAWETTAEARKLAEAQNWSAVDYGTLFAGGERVQQSLKQVNEGAAAVNALAQQLYVDRSKVLLELDDEGHPRQRVRVIETKQGQVTQQERWEDIDVGRFRQVADNRGMVVERKAAGKYDSETVRTAEPPAYAYVAQPGQANQYGSWSNGVWHWLPQYLILSQMMRGGWNQPITTGDYSDYDRARRRGETWYGRGGEFRRPWSWSSRSSSTAGRVLDSLRSSRSSGGWYKERPRMEDSGSGYSGSRYQNRGSYSGSRYQSRGSSSAASGRGRTQEDSVVAEDVADGDGRTST